MSDGLDFKWRIVPRDGGRAALLIECERGCNHGGTTRECHRSLWQKPAQAMSWEWDGNVEQPTIKPSIDCKGGCNRHFTLTKGVLT